VLKIEQPCKWEVQSWRCGIGYRSGFVTALMDGNHRKVPILCCKRHTRRGRQAIDEWTSSTGRTVDSDGSDSSGDEEKEEWSVCDRQLDC